MYTRTFSKLPLYLFIVTYSKTKINASEISKLPLVLHPNQIVRMVERVELSTPDGFFINLPHSESAFEIDIFDDDHSFEQPHKKYDFTVYRFSYTCKIVKTDIAIFTLKPLSQLKIMIRKDTFTFTFEGYGW